MSLKERFYSVLVVSSAEKLNTALSSVLPESRYGPIRFAGSITSAKQIWNERDFDFVIINSRSSDEDIRFAIDAAGGPGTVVLLIIPSSIHDDVHEIAAEHGVFTLAKPLSFPMLVTALDWMESARERLRKLEKKTLSVEEKMREIRLVNRAKWLLISELKMDEPQAHRYIEKQAMDRCVSKAKIAEELIKTYS